MNKKSTKKDKCDSRKLKNSSHQMDKDRDSRIKNNLCAYCFYFDSSRMAGQAFTEWCCDVCSKIHTHANTATPVVCDSCSKDHSLCVQCGRDINEMR